jgi:hypothetical protein
MIAKIATTVMASQWKVFADSEEKFQDGPREIAKKIAKNSPS